MLPRNSQSKNVRAKARNLAMKVWQALGSEDLKNLGQKIKEKFHWKHEPRAFQLDAIASQLKREDVLIHAGTGSGKTAIAAGPHAHEKMKGKVTFLISPLIALQDEQTQTFRDEFDLEAIAINSALDGGCTRDVMNDIVSGRWQIVVISPEMILSKKFLNNVIRKPELGKRVLSIVVDEAHVVSHWGSEFRKHYGTLGMLRALLPKGTPFVAMSATLPERVRKDVLARLQFNQKKYNYLNLGNDRTNVSLVVRAMHNAMNTYSDLDFLVPQDTRQPADVSKAFIYADSVSSGFDMVDHLDSLLPSALQGQGLVRPYNAALSKECRDVLMELFKAGHIRILVCTDAAGMGCNIPDIDIVVQWKLTATVSSFVQRAGRAARAAGRTGLAVLLVEKSVYDADLDKAQEASTTTKKKNVRQAASYPKAESKDYPIQRGVLRGAYNGKTDTVTQGITVPIDIAAIDEGAHSLVQTTTCRRRVLMRIYGNDVPNPTVPCCDICCPELLNRTRPAAPHVNSRAKPVAYEAVNPEIQASLKEWRTKIWTRDFEDAIFAASAFLSDNAVERLSSVTHPIDNLISLERAIGGGWAWFGPYGDELLAHLISLPFKSMGPKPKGKKESKKRMASDVVGVHDSAPNSTKRARSDGNVHTPVEITVPLAPGVPSSPYPPPGYPAMYPFWPYGYSPQVFNTPVRHPGTPLNHGQPVFSSPLVPTGAGPTSSSPLVQTALHHTFVQTPYSYSNHTWPSQQLPPRYYPTNPSYGPSR